MLKFLSFFCLLAPFFLSGKEAPHILRLLPELACPFAVDPGVPPHFAAVSPSGKLDARDWIYWGPKRVLENYLENPASLKTPIIRVRLSGNVTQIGPNTFSKALVNTLFEMKKASPRAFSSSEFHIGGYPLTAARARVDGKLQFYAWVGLNDPEQGWTLVFNLIYPDEPGHPDERDCELWRQFLMETRALKGEDFLWACGQQMELGYTVVSIGGAKLMMSAEERKCDQKLQVVVKPLMNNVTFACLKMEDFPIQTKWNDCSSLLKVSGSILKKDVNDRVSSINYVTSVFVKKVSEFSVISEDKAKEKYNLICQPFSS